MKKLLFLFSLFLCSLLGAQNIPTDQEAYHILKEGVLLVRIPQHTKTLDALKKQGKIKDVEELTLLIKQEDYETRSVFKAEYNFGKVYFFYSSDSKNILEGEWTGHIFDADSQVVDLPPCSFLLAEFGETQSARIGGLVISAPVNGTFIQMKKPFPYFVRRSEFLGLFKRTTGEMVHIWNDKLKSANQPQ